MLGQFINPDEVLFLQYNQSIMSDLSYAITLTVPVKNKELQLELIEVPSSFYNYQLVTNNGEKYHANNDIKHYRGIVKDDPHSIVAITFYGKEIMGLVATDEGNFNLSFDKKLNKHLFYNDKNMKQKLDFECGTSAIHSKAYYPEILFRDSKLESSSNLKCVYFYFETEYDIYQTLGSLESVESFITGIYNQVATLYQNENIETRISEINVWTSSDPYTSATTADLLSQFQSNRTDINGDLGQLLTFRSIGGGRAAGFDGICNTNVAERLSVAMLYNSYLIVPNYSWSVQVVTHELGHLFGSRHTHACVWNGNNTAIDGCGACQESPDPEDATCDNCPRPSIPSGGGTIMSYCHLESVGINFNLGFGTQPGNVIRNNVENSNCLCECVFQSAITGPIIVEDEATYDIADFPEGATVSWSTSNSNLVLISGQGTSTPTFISSYYGPCTIYAAISNECHSTTLQYNVTADFNLYDVYLDGPDFACGTSATFTIHNLPQPSTISWNNQSFTTDSVYTVFISYYSGNPGVAKVKASANYKGKIVDLDYNFSFNYPGTCYVEDTVMCNNGFYYDAYSGVAGVSVSYLYPASGITYEWSCNNGWTLVSGGTDYAMFEGPPTESNIDVKVCFNNPCGQRTCLVRQLYMPLDLYGLLLTPNPTTFETTVSIGTTSNKSSFGKDEEWSLEVYDARQTLKTKVPRIKGNNTKIQTSGWMEGVYLVRAIWKGRVLTGKLIVKR